MDRHRHRRDPQGEAGAGHPPQENPHPFATEAEATRAAEAAVSGAARAAMTLNATLAGFEPGLLAGGSVTLSDLAPPELNGEWHIESVSHELRTGLITSFRAKKGEG